jgi:predicted ATPase/class 3 adenylate cyclase
MTVVAGVSAQRAILMTDLESSTAHLRALGDEYASVLAQHHTIVRGALEKEDGLEVGSEGDSFAAVFPGTTSALRAAVAIQRGLNEADWPDAPWRVRIAIHCGPVEMTEAGAVGMSLHEAARIRAVVHGGQVVVSDAARHAIDEPVPADIALSDLGLHTVRDFDAPLRLLQVCAPGLTAEFPPLRTMSSRDVPVPRTSFIGRVGELDELLDALGRSRLVTIAGPGGSGKTRLAFETARRAEFESVAVSELASLRDPSQVAAEVARVVGANLPDDIAPAIGQRDLLLVVDNCEHVLPAIAPLVSRLLDACNGLVVLATSREPLGLTGETVWQAPQLQPDDALTLFKARAAGSADDDALVRAACERLARMPLAIELAAARVRSVPLDDLVARLDDQLRLLTSGARDIPRQQTLRATLDWSHDLLTTSEQTVFRRLGVFAGGFTLEAAEAVATHPSDVDVLDALDGLVLKSLVDLSSDTRRYSMLEPVRQYAIERLHQVGEEDVIGERHARWASHAAAEGGRNVFTAEQRRWTAVLRAERENFGAAIRWALDHGKPPIAIDLVTALAWYRFTSDRNDAFFGLPEVLAITEQLEPKYKAKVLLAAGITYCDFTVDQRPISWLLEAETIFKDLGHERAVGSVLFWLGRAAGVRDALDVAERAFTESVEVHERLGDRFGWGWSKLWLGSIARRRGEVRDSEIFELDVLSRCEDIPQVMAAVWDGLGQSADRRGDVRNAMEHNSRALEIFRELDDRWQVALVLGRRAGYAASLSLDMSAACVIASLEGFRVVGSDPDTPFGLVAAAALLIRAGRSDEAAVLAGGIDRRTVEAYLNFSPLKSRELVDDVLALLDDPAAAVPLERGSRLGLRDLADAAIDWLGRAYPASASISV